MPSVTLPTAGCFTRTGDQPPKKKKAAPKRKILSDISDLSDDESVQSKPAPKKKGRAKKDDSDMSDEDFGMKEMSKKPPGISDDDDWDAIMATGPKRSTAAARPKVRKTHNLSDLIDKTSNVSTYNKSITSTLS